MTFPYAMILGALVVILPALPERVLGWNSRALPRGEAFYWGGSTGMHCRGRGGGVVLPSHKQYYGSTPTKIWATVAPTATTIENGPEDHDSSRRDDDDDQDNHQFTTIDDAAAMLRSVTFWNVKKDNEPEVLSDFLMEIGACSTSITDSDRGTSLEQPVFREPNANNSPFLTPDGMEWLPPIWNRCNVTAHFPSSVNLGDVLDLIAAVFPEQYPLEEFNVERIPNRDWVVLVQQSWSPIVIGDYLLRFPWHKENDIEKALAAIKIGTSTNKKWIELKLQGGIAFGTGEHPTTQLCLEWIQEEIRSMLADDGQRQDITVMDYGSGSGILGLAACALAPDTIKSVGIDIDLDAIQIANANAGLNGLSLRSFLPPLSEAADDESKSLLLKAHSLANKLSEGDLLSGPLILPRDLDKPTYDIGVANILAEPLVGLASTMAGLIKPGGKLAMSGILPPKADMVIEAYSKAFDDVKLEREMGGWVLVTATRKVKP